MNAISPCGGPQDPGDQEFERALLARDENALAAECLRRLLALKSGSTLYFRADWKAPIAWRMPPRPMIGAPPWTVWARAAARALIQSTATSGPPVRARSAGPRG